MDIRERLEELSHLKAGWLEGDGLAPSHAGLIWLSKAFDGYFISGESVLPYLYPTPEGNIRAEWSIAPHEISLDIDLNSHRADYHDLNLDDNAEDPRSLNLDESADWQWLATKIEETARVPHA